MGNYNAVYAIEQGLYALHTELKEVKMSHWVNCFYIVEVQTGIIVLDFRIKLIDLIDYQEVDKGISVLFRIYPEGHVTNSMIIDLTDNLLLYRDRQYSFDKLQNVL